MFRIHGDPRTNVHNPAGPDSDRASSRIRLDEWLEHWDRYGFGYWVVEATASTHDPRRVVVGFSGVRNEVWLQQPVLNLDTASLPRSGVGAMPVLACTRSTTRPLSARLRSPAWYGAQSLRSWTTASTRSFWSATGSTNTIGASAAALSRNDGLRRRSGTGPYRRDRRERIGNRE